MREKYIIKKKKKLSITEKKETWKKVKWDSFGLWCLDILWPADLVIKVVFFQTTPSILLDSANTIYIIIILQMMFKKNSKAIRKWFEKKKKKCPACISALLIKLLLVLRIKFGIGGVEIMLTQLYVNIL